MTAPIRSIAIIDPIGDLGIGAYTYELAEGLAAHGIRVDVFTNGLSQMKDLPLPRHHRLLPVLGSLLARQRAILRHAPTAAAGMPSSGRGDASSSPAATPARSRLVVKARNVLMRFELALYLKKSRYDLIWTQWPDMPPYGTKFWSLCKTLGMRVVHTVHNVLPHEESADDHDLVREVYKYSDSLLVHSEYTRQELLRLFPECKSKTLLMYHGLYTMYPRLEGERTGMRKKLDIPDGALVLLCFGSIRPYKNIDSVLEAVVASRRKDTILVVAGRESGFPDIVQGEPLGRTRRLAQNLGLLDRVKLIPGLLDLKSTSELFEAADILLLPYGKSYGSGALLLGMTFGIHIVATRAGGMDEYLPEYPAHTLLEGPDVSSITKGIDLAAEQASRNDVSRRIALSHFEWTEIARTTMQRLTAGIPNS
jgi:glycosyltransferase involved in cell wall biosynthesis